MEPPQAAVAGASQLKRNAGSASAVAGLLAKILRSSPAEGRRGVHESNSFSNALDSFISIIAWSFQERSQFLQPVAVTARRGVRRDVQQLADLFKSVLMPELQHDDLALFLR